jgi:hypothetical protein
MGRKSLWYSNLSAEERKAYNKRKNFKFKYGISVEEYDELLAAQGGLCAICGQEKKLFLDHDHVSKRVRGLLCRNCNVALGHFYDDPGLLTSAAAYLLQRSLDGPLRQTVGGVSRTDNTEPSEFTQTDVVTVYLSKEIS